MNTIFSFFLALLLSLALSQPAWCGNIDPDAEGHCYAWSGNAGWMDFEASQGPGVTVTDIALIGYVWAENIGWIRLDPNNGGVKNDGNGILSGWGWSSTAGWISFSSENHGGAVDYCVSIDPYTGEFSGYAWSENTGWIKFDHAQAVSYSVKTSWTNKPTDIPTLNQWGMLGLFLLMVMVAVRQIRIMH